jgi:beta-N-acetylhexosaminidase
VPDRAARAQAAGCDIALNCWAKMDDMVGIAKALAPMSAETAARLQRALAPTGDFAAPVDYARQAERMATRDRLLELAA